MLGKTNINVVLNLQNVTKFSCHDSLWFIFCGGQKMVRHCGKIVDNFEHYNNTCNFPTLG